MFSTPEGDTISTWGRYHDEYEGYHGYTGGVFSTMGCHTISIVLQMTFPHINHDITGCTDDMTPVYSTLPGVLHRYYAEWLENWKEKAILVFQS